jgi:hypothetical protein
MRDTDTARTAAPTPPQFRVIHHDAPRKRAAFFPLILYHIAVGMMIIIIIIIIIIIVITIVNIVMLYTGAVCTTQTTT